MYWQTKVAWSETLVTAALVKDIESGKGVSLGDAIVYAGTAVSVGAIWYPEIRAVILGAALATPFAAPAAAAAVSAFAIGGIISYAAAPEGKEAEALVEYAKDPIGTTYDIISKEVKETKTEAIGVVSLIYNIGLKQAQRKVSQVEAGIEAAGTWLKENQRFLTGPYLPF